ncbi:TrmB family transcriptional regulator [Carnobacterium antarcticum]|uniref:TrmB family transcriptional regulator n=1 Tax=Carnobacterium antarcticum TaxID=2126436 RepID=A0ABW4NIU1_9LACT|nr:TrmB family transcriptional regulator [Carnobacterium sp. CP1]ALV21465.1 Transcriptional regulator, TrmB [Carnobacterium sp. CP1]
MEHIITIMKDYQFSEYETLVYMALLKKSNQTGYETSKNSSVPRSKVYNILEILLKKGVIICSNTDPVRYKAKSVEELIDRLNKKVQSDFNEIKKSLGSIEKEEETDILWSLSEYNQVIEKSIQLIRHSQKDLYLQIWEEDLTEMMVTLLTEAEKRLDKFIVILFSKKRHYELPFNRFYKHGFEEDKLKDYGSRWITVVADSKEVVYGTFPKGQPDVIWTRNHSMVKLSKEYVIHDAYNLRMINQLEDPAKQVFGKDLMDVRNIYGK